MSPETYAKKVAQARKLRATQKRIRPVSKKRASSMAEYRKLAKVFIQRALIDSQWRYCPVMWSGLALGICSTVSEVHHTRGRVGKLLLEERFWLAVSAEGHRWIHDHPEEARKHGWLCQPGEWNKQP